MGRDKEQLKRSSTGGTRSGTRQDATPSRRVDNSSKKSGGAEPKKGAQRSTANANVFSGCRLKTYNPSTVPNLKAVSLVDTVKIQSSFGVNLRAASLSAINRKNDSSASRDVDEAVKGPTRCSSRPPRLLTLEAPSTPTTVPMVSVQSIQSTLPPPLASSMATVLSYLPPPHLAYPSSGYARSASLKCINSSSRARSPQGGRGKNTSSPLPPSPPDSPLCSTPLTPSGGVLQAPHLRCRSISLGKTTAGATTSAAGITQAPGVPCLHLPAGFAPQSPLPSLGFRSTICGTPEKTTAPQRDGSLRMGKNGASSSRSGGGGPGASPRSESRAEGSSGGGWDIVYSGESKSCIAESGVELLASPEGISPRQKTEKVPCLSPKTMPTLTLSLGPEIDAAVEPRLEDNARSLIPKSSALGANIIQKIHLSSRCAPLSPRLAPLSPRLAPLSPRLADSVSTSTPVPQIPDSPRRILAKSPKKSNLRTCSSPKEESTQDTVPITTMTTTTTTTKGTAEKEESTDTTKTLEHTRASELSTVGSHPDVDTTYGGEEAIDSTQMSDCLQATAKAMSDCLQATTKVTCKRRDGKIGAMQNKEEACEDDKEKSNNLAMETTTRVLVGSSPNVTVGNRTPGGGPAAPSHLALNSEVSAQSNRGAQNNDPSAAFQNSEALAGAPVVKATSPLRRLVDAVLQDSYTGPRREESPRVKISPRQNKNDYDRDKNDDDYDHDKNEYDQQDSPRCSRFFTRARREEDGTHSPPSSRPRWGWGHHVEQDVRSELYEHKRRIAELEKTNKEWEKTVGETKKEMRLKEDENASLRQDQDRAKEHNEITIAQLNSVIAECNAKDDKISALQAEEAKAKREIAGLKSEIAGLESEIAEQETSKKTMRDYITKLTSERQDTLKTDKRRLEFALAQEKEKRSLSLVMEETVKELEARNSRLQNHFEALEIKNAELDSEYANARFQTEKCQADLTMQVQESKKLLEQNLAWGARFKEMGEKYEARHLKERMTQAHALEGDKGMDAIENEFASLREQLELAREQTQTTLDKVHIMDEAFEREREQLEKTLEEAEDERENEKALVLKLGKKVEKLKGKLMELQPRDDANTRLLRAIDEDESPLSSLHPDAFGIQNALQAGEDADDADDADDEKEEEEEETDVLIGREIERQRATWEPRGSGSDESTGTDDGGEGEDPFFLHQSGRKGESSRKQFPHSFSHSFWRIRRCFTTPRGAE